MTDSDDTINTTCPACGSVFQVASAQLQQASGKVRCGSCLKVFDGVSGEVEFIAPKLADENSQPLADYTVRPMAGADMPVRKPPTKKGYRYLLVILSLLLAGQLLWDRENGTHVGLEISQLLIRKDSQREGALRLDAKLLNRTEENRPFPALELRLSNQFGEDRGQRTFLPAEYLHGDWEKTPLLPAKSEIQVSLTLQDPGHDAINYTARLQSVTD